MRDQRYLEFQKKNGVARVPTHVINLKALNRSFLFFIGVTLHDKLI